MSENVDFYEIIRRNYTTLVNEIDVEFLVDHLYQDDVVDVHDMEKIRNICQNKCKRDGAKELLKMLQQKRSQAVHKFLSILPDVGYADLADRLKESGDRPLPELQSKVLENYSNRILQLEQQVAVLSSETQELKAEGQSTKAEVMALKSELASNKNMKTQTESSTNNNLNRTVEGNLFLNQSQKEMINPRFPPS